MKVHVIMQMVDLGGRSVCGFRNKTKAEKKLAALEEKHRKKLADNFMEAYGWDQARATEHTKLCSMYYIETVNVV